jgi:23S rRNA (uracil1939-C5)-methyltransferase
LQHIAYAGQARLKEEMVREALERIGKFVAPPIRPIIPADPVWHYRNKVLFPIRQMGPKVEIGFFRKDSHQLVPVHDCRIQIEPIMAIANHIRDIIQADRGVPIYDEATHRGILRHLFIRIAPRSREIIIGLVVRSHHPELSRLANRIGSEVAKLLRDEHPEVALAGLGIIHNPSRTNAIITETGFQEETIIGQNFLHETFHGISYRFYLSSFFQVNPFQTQILIDELSRLLDTPVQAKTALDLYCGAGLFSLQLARRGITVWGVEENPASIANARFNASSNHLANANFIAGRVEESSEKLPPAPDLIVLDPPRKGCQPEVIAAMKRLAAKQIIYISCNPASLARDLKMLLEEGEYGLESLQPVDMFPQTIHVETIAALRRR